MGDSRRFDLFSKLIEKHISKDSSIADVASGKGYLRAALYQLGFKNVVSWDKRKRNGLKHGYRYDYFNWQTKEKYDAIVAMHPDEGTDHSVLYAGKHQIPALICPCCVKWDAVVYWDPKTKFNTWVKHLKKLAEDRNLLVQETLLKMNGRNLVLIMKPKH